MATGVGKLAGTPAVTKSGAASVVRAYRPHFPPLQAPGAHCCLMFGRRAARALMRAARHPSAPPAVPSRLAPAAAAARALLGRHGAVALLHAGALARQSLPAPGPPPLWEELQVEVRLWRELRRTAVP